MKKQICGILTFFWLISQGSAQQVRVVWEKSYHSVGIDQISTLVKVNNGYLAGGSLEAQGIRYKNYIIDSLILVRLNESGDTINFFKLNKWGRIVTLKQCPDGSILGVAGIVDTVPSPSFVYSWSIRLYKFNELGQVLWFVDYPNTGEGGILDMCVLADGGALMVGTKTNPNNYNYLDGFALRVDPNGQELWRKTFNPSILTYLRHAEILNGYSDRFLISGNAGQYIWCARLDKDGNTLTERRVYYDSSNTQLYDARVLQSPNGHLVAWCRNIATTITSYFGVYDINGINPIYPQKIGGTVSAVYVNSGSEILMQCFNPSGSIFRKYNPDATIADTLVMSGDLNHTSWFTDVSWSNGDSAVFAGFYQTDRNNFRRDFYFVKIAGVGHEYIAAVPSIVSEKPFTLFPNPAKDWFSVSGEGVITLYTASGQEVLRQAVKEEDKVSLAGLPQGLYMYRFVSGHKVLSGKVVRE